MTAPPTKEQVQAAADRAEARSRGETAKDFVETTATLDTDLKRLAALEIGVYESVRVEEAKRLKMRAGILDKLVQAERDKASKGKKDKDFILPHWNVEPWPNEVSGADLLNGLRAIFHRYVYAPSVVPDAAALWVVHAWTINAGDISPFFVLVSPTKRCGKTTVLILLSYLTPRSELASNISPSALFRYIEDIKPTLLIDEADSFVGASEEMRGILNSGHTKAAANVIRNVEVNGEHKPKRFSVWAPKAIATIRDLADTLEDRSIVVQLQRKPKTAKVARLRKRDCPDFADLRSKASRWAEDNFAALAADPDPNVPEELNDRAADNWRPLLAIADLAGGDWPRRAREAACILSGAGHEAMAINVECLGDIKLAFDQDEAMRSADLAEALNADLERPWATWNKGKPLSQKQLANLLKPFRIVSETVHIEGLADAKGYKRTSFEEAWAAYLPPADPGDLGQNRLAGQDGASDPSKRPNADGMGTSDIFSSVQEPLPDGSKNGKLAYSHAGLDAWTDRKAETGAPDGFDQDLTPQSHAQEVGPQASERASNSNGRGPISDYDAAIEELREREKPVCEHCGKVGGGDATPFAYGEHFAEALHPRCRHNWLVAQGADLDIPAALRRGTQ